MEYVPPRPKGYSAIQISLHWLIAALVVFQLVFGEDMGRALDATEDGLPVPPDYALSTNLHVYVGIAILVLAAIRLVMRLGRGTPPPPDSTPRWQSLAADVVHWAFYLLLIGVPISGLVAWYVTPEAGDLHSIAKPAFIVLIALHVAAVLYHQFVTRDAVARRMFVPSD